eukprot:3554564-Rhodomonas_salina.3
MLEGRMGGREGGSEYEGLVYDAEGGELQRDLIRADVVWTTVSYIGTTGEGIGGGGRGTSAREDMYQHGKSAQLRVSQHSEVSTKLRVSEHSEVSTKLRVQEPSEVSTKEGV